MNSSSTRHLVHDDLEAGALTPRAFSPTFVDEASHSQRAASTPLSLITGTGYHIYNDLIIPQILSAAQEVILVTCFWAASATRDALHNALLELSAKAQAADSKISFHICFSTYSLARNLLLPTPKRGQQYQTKEWRKLGLPHSSRIPGLELRVTRKFDWPWGIMHSKYVVLDRKIAILPSCNVSWERWLEAAISMQGPVVDHLLKFHAWFWENGSPLPPLPSQPLSTGAGPAHSHHTQDPPNEPVATTLLPSPHTPSLLPSHLHPSIFLHQLPCLPSRPPTHPATPLLTTTSHLLSTAQHSILLITPNVTAPSVLAALRDALSPPRKVNVTIWTNKSLMTAEQLVTAGTTTPRCLDALKRWHSGELARLQGLRKRNSSAPSDATGPTTNSALGSLTIHYFDNPSTTKPGPGTRNAHILKSSANNAATETTPIKLHAKITVIDGDKLLLGSCNMDAASWGTSQELGVLLESRELAERLVEGELAGKLVP